MAAHYLTACAIFRNEAPYLAEWIAFHRLVGIEHFYLYDNDSTDNPESVLAPLQAKGLVTLIRWPQPYHLGAARDAYTDCLGQARGRSRWLACIDVDEFLFPPRHDTLAPVLRDYEEFPGLVVRWQVYGSSGRERGNDEPVISRFTQRAPSTWIRNLRTKSIVDPRRTLRALGSHHFEYAGGVAAVDERKVPAVLKRNWKHKKKLRPLYRWLGPALRFVDPYARTDIGNRTISVEQIRINHYPVKSREEFEAKARLKHAKKRYVGVDYFAYHDRNDVHDPILLKFVSRLKAAMTQQTASDVVGRDRM